MGLIFEVRRPEAEKEKVTRSYLYPGGIRVIPDFTESSLGYLGIVCDTDSNGVILDLDEAIAIEVKDKGHVDFERLTHYPILSTIDSHQNNSKPIDFKPEPEETGQIVVGRYEPGLN